MPEFPARWMLGNGSNQSAPTSIADLARLKEHFITVQLQQGQVLAEPGDDVRKVYFPNSGIVSIVVHLAGGSMIQTSMVDRDGAIGVAQSLDDKNSSTKSLFRFPAPPR